jgi:hypothetical protein
MGTYRSYNSDTPETEYEAKGCGNDPQKNNPYIFLFLALVIVFVTVPYYENTG